MFFRCRYCRKTEIRNDSAKSEVDDEEEVQIEVNKESTEDYVPTCPPKNALLLTRCRSAPYRTSSLASRFWASSETGEKTEDFGNEIENRGRAYEPLEKRESDESIPEIEDLGNTEEKLGGLKLIGGLIGRNGEEIEDNLGALKVTEDTMSGKGEENEDNFGDLKVIEDLMNKKGEEVETKLGDFKVIEGLTSTKSEEIEEKVIKGLISRKSEDIAPTRAQPVVLMRCKSEPARTGERLNPNLVVN